MPILAAGTVLLLLRAAEGTSPGPIRLRFDPHKTVGPVPAMRGVHMAPLNEGYQEQDVLRLKEVGATCVRFGFSGLLLEKEDRPGEYDEAGFQYLDRFIRWCETHAIAAILDMHQAIGRRKWEDARIWKHYFGSPDPKEYQDRFVNLWREIARRFALRKGVAAYELLNEPNPPEDDFDVWNELAHRTTAAIREVDKTHPIIVDSIGCANPAKFRGLKPTGDAQAIYSFHNYEPRDYHQQKRPWSFSVDGETYYYPGVINGKYWNRRQLRAVLDPPVEFAKRHGSPLFCGEFGCVSDCPLMTDMIYLMDEISLFHELGIGWTMFGYLRRESKPYWKTHFDCNLFIYFEPEEKLYRFDRKINLLRFFLETRGYVLDLDQPEDDDVTFYGVKEPSGTISLLISNKDREKAKRVRIEAEGLNPDTKGLVSVMTVEYDDFEPAGDISLEGAASELALPALSITKLVLTGQHAGAETGVDQKTCSPQQRAGTKPVNDGGRQ